MKTASKPIVILLVLSYLIILSLLTSCTGAKSLNKNEERNDSLTKVKNELALKEIEIQRLSELNESLSQSITQTNNNIVSEEGIAEPIDPTKPASITTPDGKTTTLINSKWTNKKVDDKSSIKIESLETTLTIKETEISSLKEKLEKKEEELRISNLKKGEQIERKQWSPLSFFLSTWWIWLIIIIILYLIYEWYLKGTNPIQLITSIIKKKQNEKTNT